MYQSHTHTHDCFLADRLRTASIGRSECNVAEQMGRMYVGGVDAGRGFCDQAFCATAIETGILYATEA